MKRYSRKMTALFMTVVMLFCTVPVSALTIEEEREMGRETMKAIRKHMNLVDDPVITGYVRALGYKVLKNLGQQPFDYTFYVLDSEVINAFALPAGHIVIHSGTIAAMHNEGELAAIIAHEIAHVTSRHISERIDKSKVVNIATVGGILAGILLGGAAGQALMMGSMGGGIQAQLAYSREDEQEADRKGLDYLVKAGYDPRFLGDAFQVMLRNSMHAPQGIPTYLSTHPGLPTRIASVENYADSHSSKGAALGRGDEKAFGAVKSRVIAMVGDIRKAHHYFQDILRQDPASGIGHHGMALVYQREQKYPEAIREFEKALAAEPANPSFMTDLGAVYILNNDFQSALNYLNRAVVLRPRSPRVLYMLGMTYEETGVEDRAVDLYQRVLLEDPENTGALERLGRLYGRQGDLARAHLHTGLYFKAEGQDEKARYHLERAKAAAASAPMNVRSRIENALRDLGKGKNDG
jgi:predicted Zn-dependent protease